MWERVLKFSHGRISVRRILLLAIATMMTFFMASLTLTTPVYADDVERNGNTITYQGNTYTDAAKSEIPADILQRAPSTEGYKYLDATGGKAHFILTSGDRTQATKGFYVVYNFTPPSTYGSRDGPHTDVNIVTVTDADQAANATQNISECDGATLGGIGWIVCPTVNFIARSMDKIYMIISDFLVVKTVTADTEAPLYQLWKIVRDIANICFVIALLVIIYSQITSVGISSYGIKNTLPRIIIAAILVNISYWVCTVAVDASNILGYAIHSMFTGIMEKFSVGANYTGTIPTWEQVAAITLAGTAAVAGTLFVLANTVSGTVFLLIPFLVSAVIAALVALIVLATRQALITIFIIISPLAFVAYILPNTEKWFTKWREAFTTLLLLFPIFSVIFSGAQLAGMAIVQSAGGNLFTIILGMAVQVAPIVVTPMLVKFSGSIIGRVAGMLNNPNKGLVDRTRNWARGAADEQRNKILAGKNRTNRLNKYNPVTRGSRGFNNYLRSREGRRKAYEESANNAFARSARGQNIEAMNRENANEKKDIDNTFARTTRGRQLEMRSRNLDVDKSEIENSYLRGEDGRKLTYRQEMAEVDKTRAHNEYEESHLGHQSDRAKRTVELEKKRIENTHQASWDNAVRTEAGLLELDLDVKRSEVRAAVAKDKLEKVQAEIVAQGHESEHILNLRGVDIQTKAGMLNIAHDIKSGTLESSVTQTAKAMAERVIAENKTTALTDNIITIDGKTIVEYAGGIKGESGQRAVTAKAKSEVSAALMEDIKNISSTMDWKLSTDNNQLYDKIKNTHDLAEKVAYTKAMAKNGGPGIGKLREVLSEMGGDGGTIVSKDQLMDFKELLSEEGKIMSAGKDIEFYLTNSAHYDASGNILADPTSGEPRYKTFDELRNNTATWKNLTPVAFASMSPPSQIHALDLLHSSGDPAYMSIIDSIRTNANALAQVKKSVVDKYSIYSDNELESMRRQGLSPVVGERKP